MSRITKPDADTDADGEETETKPLQESDGKGAKETVTDDEGDGKESREPKGHSFKFWWIPCLISVIAALAALLVLLLLYLKGRKRKVCGTVLEADGRPMVGAYVILTAGTDTLETHTDKNGRFSFDNLEKSRCTLDISRNGGREVLFMDICMDGRDEEEMFRICSSHCSHIEPSYKKGCYVVDITV